MNDLDTRLKELLKQRDQLNREIKVIRDEMARRACPFSKGDKFAIKGKRGHWIVSRVTYWPLEPWRIVATTISTKGNTGKGETYFTQEDEIRLVESRK